MSANPISPAKPRLIGKAVTGALLAVVGSLSLAALFLVSYGHTPELERAFLKLGLGLPGLIAGVGETLTLIGVWMLWSAAHRR